MRTFVKLILDGLKNEAQQNNRDHDVRIELASHSSISIEEVVESTLHQLSEVFPGFGNVAEDGFTGDTQGATCHFRSEHVTNGVILASRHSGIVTVTLALYDDEPVSHYLES